MQGHQAQIRVLHTNVFSVPRVIMIQFFMILILSPESFVFD